jgi:hypothetical protein
MNRKFLIIGLGILLVAILAWAFMESIKPKPGQVMLQDGRDHKAEGAPLEYKFNPPTSGDHYPSWIAKGFYEEPRFDGNLVHSLEHGYVIFWYDCDKKLGFSLIPEVLAQATQMTNGLEGSPSAKLSDMPKSFSDGSCDTLKNQIRDQIKNLGDHKLIAVPRVGMDSPLILTAWGRMEKLSGVDQKKVKNFVSAFRDNGPERTVEP